MRCHQPVIFIGQTLFCLNLTNEGLPMKRAAFCFAIALIPTLASANEAVQHIEEVVVTGAVRGNDAIQVAEINLPGDADLAEMPVISE
ncbi:MAG: hypothetical protein CMN84_06455 [Spongiibacteraceae bacterium]|nr:hypothetical protein [Spongiibacteraceae bacterium]